MPGPLKRDDPNEAAIDRRANPFTAAFALAFLLLLEALSWLTNRGGVFSLTQVWSRVQSEAPTIEVDKNGLRAPILLLTWTAVLLLMRVLRLRLDPSNRAMTFAVLAAVIGGGFVLDGAYGHQLIDRVMVRHGYHRCEQADHERGNGKSRVWFAGYVRWAEACVRRLGQ